MPSAATARFWPILPRDSVSTTAVSGIYALNSCAKPTLEFEEPNSTFDARECALFQCVRDYSPLGSRTAPRRTGRGLYAEFSSTHQQSIAPRPLPQAGLDARRAPGRALCGPCRCQMADQLGLLNDIRLGRLQHLES